ncbi:hypothetical protein V5O48_006487 [Marasmius crinis-equi]|uniref:Uncharacterized protein n=1 Tax=Marasmius crinis-equi TaxID=585013 RepID=A0ABR3FJF1_9AGAR
MSGTERLLNGGAYSPQYSPVETTSRWRTQVLPLIGEECRMFFEGRGQKFPGGWIPVPIILKARDQILSQRNGEQAVDEKQFPEPSIELLVEVPICEDTSQHHLSLQCDHGRLTVQGLLYNVAVILNGFMQRPHRYFPDAPRLRSVRNVFVKSLFRGDDGYWRVEILMPPRRQRRKEQKQAEERELDLREEEQELESLVRGFPQDGGIHVLSSHPPFCD